MRASVIQFEAGADKRANIAAMGELLDAAIAADSPDLVSLPEMWTCLGGTREMKLSQGERLVEAGSVPEAGSAYAFLSAFARRHSVTVHGGSIGELVGDRLFNTTLVFGRQGDEVGRYRKIHLFDVTTPGGQGYRESSLFGAGESVISCDVGGARLGLAICYDLRFPELFLALRRAGASVIMVPSAFTRETGQDHWEVLLRARAIETQCWIVAAATTGQHRDGSGAVRETYGNSLICDPWGRVVARLGDTPSFATATLEFDAMQRVRAAMPVLDHRRLA